MAPCEGSKRRIHAEAVSVQHHPHCDQALVILGESPANKLTLPKTSVSPHKDQAWEQGSITSPLTRQGQVRVIKFPELGTIARDTFPLNKTPPSENMRSDTKLYDMDR